MQPWAGIHIREEGTKRGIPTTSREARDMVKRMIIGGEMATKREGTEDHHGLMKTSSSGILPTRSQQNSHRKSKNWATSS